MESTTELAKTLGLAHKLFLAGDAVGFLSSEWNTLGENRPMLAALRKVIAGEAHIVLKRPIVDFAAPPFIPEGWKLRSHRRDGFFGKPFEFNIDVVVPWNVHQQRTDQWMSGDEMERAARGLPVMNACALDFFLENKHLIPASFKKLLKENKYILFWGTIYEVPGGKLGVRSLSKKDLTDETREAAYHVVNDHANFYTDTHYLALYREPAEV